MSSDFSLKVDGVSKTYDVFKSPAQRIAQIFAPKARLAEKFRALKEVSFQVNPGDFFGIIGQNGSGKSTLLQIIAGILPPTTGKVHVNGRVAALLELGAGFNPEFTGRENARLNAQILGISGAEFNRVLPEIEAFAGIGHFIDQPVKTYSSGMFVRLAFAVQACIDPDILIVDEALAVGDIFFRLKCYERLERLRKKGCTIILVTHSMDDILHYCDKVLLLNYGDPVFFGDPVEAVNRYYALGHLNAHDRVNAADQATIGIGDEAGGDPPGAASRGDAFEWPAGPFTDMGVREQIGPGTVRCLRMALMDHRDTAKQVFRQGELMRLYCEFETTQPLETPCTGFVIRTEKGVVVHGKHTAQTDELVPGTIGAGSIVRAVFEIPLNLGPGEYVVDLGFSTWPRSIYSQRARVTMAELESSATRHCVIAAAQNFSIIPRGQLGYDAQPFYGLAGLESSTRVMLAE
ncbi:ABC transporter ATP-binding protein [Burkholderia stagnalis]|uniref:ABC transporter ATP-binding protein n=1 Tax=Burkholderia stagnalis TaxID=1503054 RepID=UPI0007C7C9CD|nr:ABC transporter ATP-binding protein [Burkholderia stagnalis]MDY7806805.1 ABC transporter ATP-binding protein [Burkholderia stagnalis]RQQ15846.1 ABC transporter ATP-binding protein [Burkholderia stagnalis]RQQ18864.1 ABC transporter ATP-binding protein [Burkholderia stagnalis]RQQ39887.1 ABC transporter ATP-binding protein [Burkholderia stagnalis]RQQ99199.1 ABC transporter ATP-binding protein [Burkholderia stagnalis]